jgi:predicted esterase
LSEHHIVVARTARYYTLGGAAGGGAGKQGEVWMVCHGYAQLARHFIRPFAAVAGAHRLIVAPEALNRYYHESAPGVHAPDARVAATWMTREDRDHEIADYIAYLDALAAHVAGDVAYPLHLTALGFSQGAATVSRWAAHGRTRIQRVVLWGAGLAHELQPAPALLRGAELIIALGDADAHVDAAAVTRIGRALTDGGLHHRLLRYAGGHEITTAALEEIGAG